MTSHEQLGALRQFMQQIRETERRLMALNFLLEQDSYALNDPDDTVVMVPASVVHPFLKERAVKAADEVTRLYAKLDRVRAALKEPE